MCTDVARMIDRRYYYITDYRQCSVRFSVERLNVWLYYSEVLIRWIDYGSTRRSRTPNRLGELRRSVVVVYIKTTSRLFEANALTQSHRWGQALDLPNERHRCRCESQPIRSTRSLVPRETIVGGTISRSHHPRWQCKHRK